jgi:hypothetical protein
LGCAGSAIGYEIYQATKYCATGSRRDSFPRLVTDLFQLPSVAIQPNILPPKNVGQHKYSVSIYDKVKHKLYLDDPKIIVGSGNNAITQLMEARKELAEVRGQIVSIEKELESAVDKLEKK